MKFVFQYKTSSGERHDGIIEAASREDVFEKLKKVGIKPYGVKIAPGLCNWFFSLGKRVYAIGILSVLLIFALWFSCWEHLQSRQANSLTSVTSERRSQIYGDPLVLQTCESKGWSNVFENQLDRVLAAYAIPAKPVDEELIRSAVSGIRPPYDLSPVVVSESDGFEVAKMKRMVNWMKEELHSYLSAGGTFVGYVERLQLRLSEEIRMRFRIENELSALSPDDANFENEWESKNRILRAMGIRPVQMPPKELSTSENYH